MNRKKGDPCLGSRGNRETKLHMHTSLSKQFYQYVCKRKRTCLHTNRMENSPIFSGLCRGIPGISRWANLPYGHRGWTSPQPGTPIYAADAGTVIAAKWHNHHHELGLLCGDRPRQRLQNALTRTCAAFVGLAGQTVEKGQLHGYGRYGAATGNHCHFEMYYNNALIAHGMCSRIYN